MSSITVKDLEASVDLDRKTMSEISGGRWKWLYRAFKAGYKVGSYLDEKFELSDRIAGTGNHWR